MKLNSSGFSLAEILVALGLFSVIGLGAMRLMDNQNKSIKTIQTASEFNELYSQLNQNFIHAKACHNTLGIDDLRNTVVEDIKNPLGDIILDKIDIVGDRTLKLSAIELKGIKELGTNNFKTIEESFDKHPIPPGELAYGELSLELTFDKIAKNNMGGRSIKKVIVLRVQVNHLYQITQCFSTVSDAVKTTRIQTCNDLGGFYSEGSGCNLSGDSIIGNQVKQAACEVYGGHYNIDSGKCNTASFSASCPLGHYLESFNLSTKVTVCKRLSSKAPILPPIVSFGSSTTSFSSGNRGCNSCTYSIETTNCINKGAPSKWKAIRYFNYSQQYYQSSGNKCLDVGKLIPRLTRPKFQAVFSNVNSDDALKRLPNTPSLKNNSIGKCHSETNYPDSIITKIWWDSEPKVQAISWDCLEYEQKNITAKNCEKCGYN